MAGALKESVIAQLADQVESAQREARAIAKLTDQWPDLTVADGYAVQAELRRRYLADGQRLVGWKAGLTSRAKMKQMGVDQPCIGFLTNAMARPESSAISTADLVHPRVECEVAFVTAKDLQGPGCTAEMVLEATDYVLPAVEIIDSRYAAFKFDLASVIADNCSSARSAG